MRSGTRVVSPPSGLRNHSQHVVTYADETPALPIEDATWHCYRDLIASWQGTQFELGTAPENIAAICFTSGSSGVAKGVMLTHTAFHCQALIKLREVGFCNSDVYLHTSPLCHVGMRSVCNPSFSASWNLISLQLCNL